MDKTDGDHLQESHNKNRYGHYIVVSNGIARQNAGNHFRDTLRNNLSLSGVVTDLQVTHNKSPRLVNKIIKLRQF